MPMVCRTHTAPAYSKNADLVGNSFPNSYGIGRVFTITALWVLHEILRTKPEKMIVLGFNDTSTLEGHFVSSPREREERDRRESRGDEREGQGRKRNRNESEETEEIKTFPLYPYPLQG